MALRNALEALSTEAKQDAIIAVLDAVLAELAGKVGEGGTVALDTATLTALEQVTATVANMPSTFPLPLSQVQVDALTNAQLRAAAVGVTDPATKAAVDALLAEVQTKIAPGDPVALEVAGVEVTAANPLPITGRFSDENGVPYSSANPLPVDVGANLQVTATFDSVISTVNSTATPLLANETFTGTWEDVLGYAAVTAAISTDADSAVEGARAQFSADGVDVLREERVSVLAGLPAYFTTPVQARYFRIIYTNGPTPQTSLEAQVSYQFNAPALVQAPLGTETDDLSLATNSRAAITGRLPTGVHIPIAATASQELVTADPAAQALLEVLRNAQAPVTPTAAQIAAAVVDQALVTPSAGQALRLRKFHLHLDPDAAGNNVVTLKVGGTVVFVDEFEPGLPYAETIVVEGAADEPLTITTTSSARLYVNVRTETFQP